MNPSDPSVAPALTPELTDQFDALEMELRGYELARRTASGWEVVAKYRPTDADRISAIVAGRELEWRARKRGRPEVYKVRPLVSVSVDFAAKPAPPELLPDVEDALVEPGELLAGLFDKAEPAPEEPSLIIKPEGTEFAGGGFVATAKDGAVGNVEIPYNYDQLAGSMDVPDPWGGEK